MGHKFELLFVGEVKPDLFSWLIERGQSRIHKRRVNFSHVAILVNGSRVFDSTGRGFDEEPLEKLLEGGRSVIRHRFELNVPEGRGPEALAWLEGRKGIPYARLQCLAVVFPILRRIPFIKNGFRRAFCSESGADFMYRWSDGRDTSGRNLVHGLWVDPRLECRDFIDPFTLYTYAPDYGSEVI